MRICFECPFWSQDLLTCIDVEKYVDANGKRACRFADGAMPINTYRETLGLPVCPYCGKTMAHYQIGGRHQLQCDWDFCPVILSTEADSLEEAIKNLGVGDDRN